jgi:hypothetical protein
MQYTVDADDATLASLGLTRVQVDSWLEYMNDRANTAAHPPARRHLAQWGAQTGALRRPVLTMHYTNDGMAFVTTENYYKALVEAAGSGDLLLQTYVTGPAGHCSFTPNQYQTALAAMNAWLDTGQRPIPSSVQDAEPPAFYFPAAPPYYFNLSFQPGPWIF